MEKSNKLSLVFLVLISICIMIFSFTIFTLIKNIDLIKKDAVSYGMEKNNFYSCVCYSDLGTVFYNMNETEYLKKSDDFKNRNSYVAPKFNYSNIILK